MSVHVVPEQVLAESRPFSVQLMVLRLPWLIEDKVLVFKELSRGLTVPVAIVAL